MPPPYDFRSDTVTQPTDAMRQAMARAKVGDDVLGEDPTINELETAGADFLGKEAALFVPSGTMGNQIAIHVYCRNGDELICEERSHVYFYEGGSIARLSGTQVRPLVAPSGFPSPDQVTAAVRSADPHYPHSRLLVIENSHNMAGGRVCSVAQLAELSEAARRQQLGVHMDGARLANAAVALGCRPAELTAHVDSVSMCLSKGLGAPVGSLLGGTAEFIQQARRTRKAFGGGMRQAGVLAAAGLLALDSGFAGLGSDHVRAQTLARGLAEVPGLTVDPSVVDTNIIMVELDAADDFLDHLRSHGVLAGRAGSRVRFVTHRDVDDQAVQQCLRAAESFTVAT